MFKKKQTIELEGSKYELIEPKGEGGSGVVWTAESESHIFAIKYIKPGNSSENKLARFKAEIAFSKKANHQNIVKVIAEGDFAGIPFYIMPYYSKTLRHVINEERDADVLVKNILKICAAVKYIHNKGIKHRDIKPENILVDGNNLVLADFGIAHFKDYNLTKAGDLLGNRNYIAPEQKLRNNALNITIAADIYALGLIINECFTKQNPVGSQFKKIADSYPLFYELDNLVESMTRNVAEERIAIDSVIAQIKFIYQKLKKNLTDIRYDLEMFGPPQKIKSTTLREIYKRASEDILFGKYLFQTHTPKEINKYNHNWHMKIGYTADDFFYNLYVQEKVLKECKLSFEYESNVYNKDSWYKPLDLSRNNAHALLYNQMAEILNQHELKGYGYLNIDLSGQILKYFSSCSDYRCEKILRNIDDIKKHAERNLKSVPIIWIVSTLKFGIEETDIKEFKLEDHITINWDRTIWYEYNDNIDELIDSCYIEKQKEIERILYVFQQEWKISFSEIDDKYYSIKFKSYKLFQKFREYALSKAKPHYIFEGDVLNILREPNYVGNMVELKVGKVFEISTTLAQILGMKEVNA